MTTMSDTAAVGATPSPRQTYTVREAAAILGVGAATLYRAIERQEVPAIRIGRRRVVATQWVDRQVAPKN